MADSLAREWRVLNEGEDRSLGNEIVIKDYTQNIFVTIDGDQLTAIFIPRMRSRLSTGHEGNAIQKSNAGVLEMMGYFVIDEPEDFKVLERMSALQRKATWRLVAGRTGAAPEHRPEVRGERQGLPEHCG